MRRELHAVHAERNPGVRFDAATSGERLFLNGRILADDTLARFVKLARKAKRPVVGLSSDVWACLYLPNGADLSDPEKLTQIDGPAASEIEREDIQLSVVSYPWDILSFNADMIGRDFEFISGKIKKKIQSPVPKLAGLLRRKNIIIRSGCSIQPLSVIDASEGPVILETGVAVQSHAYIQGPVWIGSGTIVRAGARVSGGSSIGETCRIGGEVTASILQSHSNKAHDGFLGHAYIGQWVNIGAGTNNSNLKNDYGPVTVIIDGEPVNTGRQFFGMIAGDHSRTAIDTSINTGSVIGVGCNIFGSDFPPKYLHDFTWGGSDVVRTYDFGRFVESARAMMKRRGRDLTEAELSVLQGIFDIRKEKNARGRKSD